MYQFYKHKIKTNGNETIITLYLDSQDVEFAEEFMGKGRPIKNLEKSAQQYVKSKFPNIKNATVKIMAGSMLIATLGMGATGAFAAENTQGSQTPPAQQQDTNTGTDDGTGGEPDGTEDTSGDTASDDTAPETDTDDDDTQNDTTGDGTTPETDTDDDDTPAADFADIEDDSYYSLAAYVLIDKEIIEGISGKFVPKKDLTRAEAATMIARALGLDTTKTGTEPVFTDVTGGWYYGAIAALKEKGVINGYKDGSYKPNDPVSRAELAKMIVEAYELQGEGDVTEKYKDLKDNAWYLKYIAPIDQAGITQGIGNNQFGPEETSTRAQAATMINRVLNFEQFGQADGMVELTAVTDATVTINGKPFEIDEKAKGILNEANAAVLENAIIYAQTDKNGQKIEKLRYLEINNSGEENNPVVFNGNGGSIDGSVVVNGDYVQFIELNINKDFTISDEVENYLALNDVNVSGKTTIKGADGVVQSASAEAGIKTGGTFEIHDTNLEELAINKNAVTLFTSGESNIGTVELSNNGKITTGEKAQIGKLKLNEGVTNVELNGTVSELEVNAKDAIEISGQASVVHLKVVNKANLDVKLTGEIKNLHIDNKDAKLKLNEQLQIDTAITPEGSAIEDLVTNFELVKENIQKINDTENPDATPPYERGVPSPEKSTIATNYIGNNAFQFLFTVKDGGGNAISELTADDMTVKLRGETYPLSSNNFSGFKELGNGEYMVTFNPDIAINETVEVSVNETTIKTDLLVNTQDFITAGIATVADYDSLLSAIDDEQINTIKLAKDIVADEKLVVARSVNIDGNNHSLSLNDAEKWQGNYVLQIYNTDNVEINNIKLTGGDAGLLVNASTVKLSGTIDVSGNEFGGIEVSKGTGDNLGEPSLDVTDATFVNETEAYGLPTLWEDKLTGKITGFDNKLTSTAEVKENQVQYYLNAENAAAPVDPPGNPTEPPANPEEPPANPEL